MIDFRYIAFIFQPMKRLLLLLILGGLHTSLNAQVRINEICAANGDLKYDPDFFDFPSYVELYNPGSADINVGDFYLSDDPAQPAKWRIPANTIISAGGYLLIWCDERNALLHTNFNLDPDGESVLFSDASGAQVDRIDFPEQFVNTSYGRLSDGGSSIGYMILSTPGAVNNGATGTVQLENPALSLEAGRYSGAQSITMVPPAEGAEIRYTTDGAEPGPSSTLYSGPVSVTQTTTIKAKAFREGFLPSKAEVRTYFINQRAFTLPVVVLSTTPSYLTDNTIGIIVAGTNGTTGPCQAQPKNWNQDWDRHAVIELFDRTGTKLIDEHVDIRVHGGCTRNNPQKSLVLRARDKFGDKTIEYKFFNSKPLDEFGSVVLRNSGNDFFSTMFRDGLIQSLPVGQMDVDYLAYQPSVVYINGNYWGIQNIREKVDGDYFEANFGISSEDVDVIETWGTVLLGTRDRWTSYVDSLNRVPRGAPEGFAFLNRFIDVQNYIDYLTAQIYLCNTDWPGNNVKTWRQRSTNGKFRWIFWDMDFGMGLYPEMSYPTHPTLEFVTDPDNTGWPNPAYATRHIRYLLEMPEFKKRFLQTLTTSLSTTFKPERVIDMINTFQNNIKTEMPHHIERWQLSLDNWNAEVERMRQFAAERNQFMRNHIKTFFGLEGDVRLSVNTFPTGAGAFKLNGLRNTTVENLFYFRDLPFEVIALPEPGYKFSHYKVKKREATGVSLINKNEVWKYNDNGMLPSDTWHQTGYSDAGWNSGPAELGYGERDEATVVGFGGNTADRYVTTYFRKSFDVADTVGFTSLTGSVLFDDGVVVYLNGEEVYRYNMPAGTIGYSTLATASQAGEKSYYEFTIPRGKIRPGTNVVAVEVHQNNVTSSDMSFNFALSVLRSGDVKEFTVQSVELKEIANSNVTVEAHFVPVAASSGLIINEFAAENSTLLDSHGDADDWIEIYNKGTQPVDLGNYFITDNLSSKLKYKIPQGKNGETIIEPGTYKLLWADDDVEQGPLHLGFKLSADGEELGLYQKVGTSIEKADEVVFGPQEPLTTFSRIPNITGEFVITGKATPLAANILELTTGIEEDPDALVSLFPNPSTGSFRIESTRPGRLMVEILNTSGQRVAQRTDAESGDEFSLRNDSPGVYIVKIQVGEKLVVKRLLKL